MRYASILGLALFLIMGPTFADDELRKHPATHSNVPYGPHERNVLDVWSASGDGPRPLLVYIHGGGWFTGDKRQKMPDYASFLERGISFAAINYRLTPDSPLPAPIHDAARAIQFIRLNAVDWNIDSDRIALFGPSAGGCTSLCLLFHDDFADPKSSEAVLRESTRVCAAAVIVPQTSIDPKVIAEWLGPNALQHPMIPFAVGEKSIADSLRNYEQHRPVYVEFSPINHVDSSDPPLFIECNSEMDLPSRNAGHGIHHPLFGVKLKKRCDEVGHECHLLVPGYSESKKYTSVYDFLIAKLLAK